MCESYAQSLGVAFSAPIPELGGALTAEMTSGSLLGIRAPMHESEAPVTRPYFLVPDINEAVENAKRTGAEVVLPSMEIPGRGLCAIVFFGPIQQGFWQI